MPVWTSTPAGTIVTVIEAKIERPAAEASTNSYLVLRDGAGRQTTLLFHRRPANRRLRPMAGLGAGLMAELLTARSFLPPAASPGARGGFIKDLDYSRATLDTFERFVDDTVGAVLDSVAR